MQADSEGGAAKIGGQKFTLNVECGPHACNTNVDNTGITTPLDIEMDAVSKIMLLGEP